MITDFFSNKFLDSKKTTIFVAPKNKGMLKNILLMVIKN